MQDVSCVPLMLWLSVNLSSKLGYFQAATPSTLLGSCIYRKAINKDKPLVQRGALIMHVRRCMEGSEKKGAAMCSPFMVNSMMSDMTPYQ